MLGAGDSFSYLGMLVMFVVGLGLRCSLVLLYTLPLTFIRYIFGSLMDWGLLRTVPVIHMLLSVSCIDWLHDIQYFFSLAEMPVIILFLPYLVLLIFFLEVSPFRRRKIVVSHLLLATLFWVFC